MGLLYLISYRCYNYILSQHDRHSFDRAKDIQEYGQILTGHMHEIKNCITVLERGEQAIIRRRENYYKIIGDEENFKRCIIYNGRKSY